MDIENLKFTDLVEEDGKIISISVILPYTGKIFPLDDNFIKGMNESNLLHIIKTQDKS